MRLKYRDITDYIYEVVETYAHQTEITGRSCRTEYIILLENGILVVSPGWKWDGASGPTYDSQCSMRGSLLHDAIYELMRLGLLPQSYREYADSLLRDTCIEDGMNELRAHLWYNSVRVAAARFAKVGTQEPDRIFEVGKE